MDPEDTGRVGVAEREDLGCVGGGITLRPVRGAGVPGVSCGVPSFSVQVLSAVTMGEGSLTRVGGSCEGEDSYHVRGKNPRLPLSTVQVEGLTGSRLKAWVVSTSDG